MQKFLIAGILLVSIGIAGWAFQGYSTSGEEIISVPVSGQQGILAPVSLDPSMSPVRVMLWVKSGLLLNKGDNAAYQFEITVIGPGQQKILSLSGERSELRTDQGSSYEENQLNHVVGVFDVVSAGPYRVVWQVIPERAEITGISILLRRNVEGLNIYMLALAGVLFVLAWGLIIQGRRRGRSL